VQCLLLIVNLFNIPATTGYLNDDMIVGLEYLKSIQLPLMGIGLYALIQGMLFISIMFGIIKVLRKNIDRFQFPKS
jgi:hypothetical protein